MLTQALSAESRLLPTGESAVYEMCPDGPLRPANLMRSRDRAVAAHRQWRDHVPQQGRTARSMGFRLHKVQSFQVPCSLVSGQRQDANYRATGRLSERSTPRGSLPGQSVQHRIDSQRGTERCNIPAMQPDMTHHGSNPLTPLIPRRDENTTAKRANRSLRPPASPVDWLELFSQSSADVRNAGPQNQKQACQDLRYRNRRFQRRFWRPDDVFHLLGTSEMMREPSTVSGDTNLNVRWIAMGFRLRNGHVLHRDDGIDGLFQGAMTVLKLALAVSRISLPALPSRYSATKAG